MESSSPRALGGFVTTYSRSRLSAMTSSGSRPRVALPEAQLQSDHVAPDQTEYTYGKVRFNNATEVVPSLSNVNAVDDWGWTALMHAAEQNHKEVHVEKLIAAGSDAVSFGYLHFSICRGTSSKSVFCRVMHRP